MHNNELMNDNTSHNRLNNLLKTISANMYNKTGHNNTHNIRVPIQCIIDCRYVDIFLVLIFL